MAFPCGVATSLIENARPTRQYLSPAKTQQENELVHVRPTLQLAPPGCRREGLCKTSPSPSAEPEDMSLPKTISLSEENPRKRSRKKSDRLRKRKPPLPKKFAKNPSEESAPAEPEEKDRASLSPESSSRAASPTPSDPSDPSPSSDKPAPSDEPPTSGRAPPSRPPPVCSPVRPSSLVPASGWERPSADSTCSVTVILLPCASVTPPQHHP